MSVVAIQGHAFSNASPHSLLFSLISDDTFVAGPLQPSAYADTDTFGSANARLAAVGGDSVDYITFTDPEVGFSSMLGGTAVISTQNPLDGEDVFDTEETDSKPKPTLYTVKAGDTIGTIASQFSISTATLTLANGLRDNDYIKPGDTLSILPVNGVLHTVRSGDTISEIARRYDVSVPEISGFNALEDGATLKIGFKLIIPGGTLPTPQPTTPPRSLALDSNDTVPTPDVDTDPLPTAEPVTSAKMVWPTTTKHLSQYFKWGHTGIDIDNRSRPAIFAAKAGKVKLTNWLGGYGNLIVIDHGGGEETYYAHLDKFYVSPGQSVNKGDAIGKMGSTGRSTGPHLHFEVRLNGRPVNPLGRL